MRQRGDVSDHSDFKSTLCKCADGRFASTTGSLNQDIHSRHAKRLRTLGAIFGCDLGRKRSAFSTSFEADSARARPTEHSALFVSDRNDGVVETRANVRRSVEHASTWLRLSFLCWFSRHRMIRWVVTSRPSSCRQPSSSVLFEFAHCCGFFGHALADLCDVGVRDSSQFR